MLHYSCYGIDISEGTGINKTSASKECVTFHYQYETDKKFKFESSANGCHDVLMMSIDINSISVSNIYGVDCLCIVAGVSKSEPVNILKNFGLS